jgi:stage 0 sporulation protein B (sporulation initiation phosphotransferase)
MLYFENGEIKGGETRMMRRFGWQALAGFAGLLAWIVLVAVRLPFPARSVLAVITAACAWYIFKAYRKEKEVQERDRLIRLLNHHRHDWMNELQVLFGYTRLKKFDILPDYMDKIRTSALHDSLLCKLGNPPLIVYLLEQRITGGACEVEVELETEIDLRKLALDEDTVYKLIKGVMDLLAGHAAPSPGEHSVVSLGFDGAEGELLVDFVYQGEADWDKLKSAITAFLGRYGERIGIREEEYGEGRAVIALALPFRT